LYDEFKDMATFYVVYIAEAHAVDEWQMESNEAEEIRLRQHTSLEERKAAARLCADQLQLTIPVLVDGMENAAFEAFSAWPERIYIIDADGRIHYQGGPGPYEFKPQEARTMLIALRAFSER
jgi:hypothetical protein